MRLVLVALFISIAGCSVSVSPVPGVNVHIPADNGGYYGGESDHHEHDD